MSESGQKKIDIDSLLVFMTPFPKEDIKISGNGINVTKINDSNDNGSAYERQCFSKLCSKPGSSVLLGPGLIDSIFMRLGDVARPDAMLFEYEGDGTLVLSEVYEFKLQHNNTEKKVKGVERLLDTIRNNPSFLPRALTRALSNQTQITFPDRIIIPPAREVDFTLISSNKHTRRHSAPVKSPFRSITYRSI